MPQGPGQDVLFRNNRQWVARMKAKDPNYFRNLKHGQQPQSAPPPPGLRARGSGCPGIAIAQEVFHARWLLTNEQILADRSSEALALISSFVILRFQVKLVK